MSEYMGEKLAVFYNAGKNAAGKIERILLGQLSRQGRDYFFCYDPNAPVDVSLTMPRREAPYRFGALHPIFQMHLPEGMARDLFQYIQNKAAGSGDLPVLLALGEPYARLIYANLTAENPQAQQVFAELIGKYSSNSAQARAAQQTSSSVHGKTALPSAYYIIKSSGSEYPDLPINEWVCLQLARAFLLPTATAQLRDHGKTLVVDRFDAPPSANAAPLGFEDFCTLQGKLPKERYASSYEDCTKVIRLFVSRSAQKTALRDFFKMLLLNTLIRNGDAHLKNFGVVYANPHQRQLAPCFDINTTTLYLKSDFMALSLAGSKKWCNWQQLAHFGAQYCQLSRANLNQIRTELEAALPHGQQALADAAKTHPHFLPTARAMEQIWIAAYRQLFD